jgi:hypothetical protein
MATTPSPGLHVRMFLSDLQIPLSDISAIPPHPTPVPVKHDFIMLFQLFDKQKSDKQSANLLMQ